MTKTSKNSSNPDQFDLEDNEHSSTASTSYEEEKGEGLSSPQDYESEQDRVEDGGNLFLPGDETLSQIEGDALKE